MDGSSSTYMTPVRPEPIWLARRMRCASPPESVSARALERQVVEPHVDEELRRLAISRTMRSAICCLAPSSCSVEKKRCVRRSGQLEIS